MDAPARGLGEVARKDVKKQPADVCKQLPIVTQETAQPLRYGPDELSVGQAQQEILAEVLPEEKGALPLHLQSRDRGFQQGQESARLHVVDA